jgi:hypothetical protein
VCGELGCWTVGAVAVALQSMCCVGACVCRIEMDGTQTAQLLGAAVLAASSANTQLLCDCVRPWCHVWRLSRSSSRCEHPFPEATPLHVRCRTCANAARPHGCCQPPTVASTVVACQLLCCLPAPMLLCCCCVLTLLRGWLRLRGWLEAAQGVAVFQPQQQP